MRRTNFALALAALLLASICAAQQTASPAKGSNTPAVGGSGSPNYIPIWIDGSDLGNSTIYQNSAGNVGLGTPQPMAKLDVNGGVNARTNYQIGGTTVLSTGAHARFNLFLGENTGLRNTSGFSNTFTGFSAGYNNLIGTYNTFTGVEAGYSNTSGFANTFTGVLTGYSNTSGFGNSFYGVIAGENTTSGISDTFVGTGVGLSNTTGSWNTFAGVNAGYSSTSGSYNTFYGFEAGYNNTTGSSNIYIGHAGPASGEESHTIRLGTQGAQFAQQNTIYIAGIYGSSLSSGVPVIVNSDGQLGTQTSSLRFKEQVRDMGDSTDALMKLRPVTFLYKPEYDKGERTLQYGLIAEEVAKVYPELVAYDKDGQPYSVRYQYLNTMLLNEVQKQYHRAEAEAEVIKSQEKKIDELEQRLSRIEALVGARVNTAQIKSGQHRGGDAQ